MSWDRWWLMEKRRRRVNRQSWYECWYWSDSCVYKWTQQVIEWDTMEVSIVTIEMVDSTDPEEAKMIRIKYGVSHRINDGAQASFSWKKNSKRIVEISRWERHDMPAIENPLTCIGTGWGAAPGNRLCDVLGWFMDRVESMVGMKDEAP